MRTKLLFSAFILSVSLSYSQEHSFTNEEVNSRVPQTEALSTSTDALQATLYELTDQYLAVHQMHWNARGPEFYSLHDLLGELYGELAGSIDMIAERKLALGAPADGRPGPTAEKANLASVPDDYVNDHDVIALLTQRYKTITDRLGTRIEEVGKTDPSTQNALIGVRRMIDLHLYKLRSFSYPSN